MRFRWFGKDRYPAVLLALLCIAVALLVWERSTTRTARPKRIPAVPVAATEMPAVSPRPTPRQIRIALVLDDWGYRESTIAALLALKEPITLAVLPGLPYSAHVCERAGSGGNEIILHLPMQAISSAGAEPDTITVSMPAGEISRILHHDLSTVPGARGVSNHTGSLATQDEAVMGRVLEVLKGRGLYFLDSYVISNSVGRTVARRAHVPSLQRDVFLDNEKDPDAITAQLEKLYAIARVRGYAVGIGHDNPITIETLAAQLPRLKARGVRFVPLSELMRDYGS